MTATRKVADARTGQQFYSSLTYMKKKATNVPMKISSAHVKDLPNTVITMQISLIDCDANNRSKMYDWDLDEE